MSDEVLLSGGEAAVEKDVESKVEEKASSFLDDLPEEYRDHPVIKTFKTPEDFAKSWSEAQKMIGQRGDIPKKTQEEAPEEWVEFYKKAGMPEKVEEYGIEGSGDDYQNLLNSMHKAGLSKSQAKKVYESLTELGTQKNEASAEAAKASRNKAYQEIVTKYGGEEQAKAALEKASGFIDNSLIKEYPEFGEFFRSAKISGPDGEVALANHPVMAEAFRLIADMVGDDSRNLKGLSEPDRASLQEQFTEMTLKMGGMDPHGAEYAQAKIDYQKLKDKLYPRD